MTQISKFPRAVQNAIARPSTRESMEQFLREHLGVVPTNKRQMYAVKKDMPVFKKVWGGRTPDAIASLIIPAGATIYISDASDLLHWRLGTTYNKMRANHALVDRIATKYGTPVQIGFSTVAIHTRRGDPGYDRHGRLIYKPDKTVTPDRFASVDAGQCAGGIHFFIDLYHAWNY